MHYSDCLSLHKLWECKQESNKVLYSNPDNEDGFNGKVWNYRGKEKDKDYITNMKFQLKYENKSLCEFDAKRKKFKTICELFSWVTGQMEDFFIEIKRTVNWGNKASLYLGPLSCFFHSQRKPISEWELSLRKAVIAWNGSMNLQK